MINLKNNMVTFGRSRAVRAGIVSVNQDLGKTKVGAFLKKAAGIFTGKSDLQNTATAIATQQAALQNAVANKQGAGLDPNLLKASLTNTGIQPQTVVDIQQAAAAQQTAGTQQTAASSVTGSIPGWVYPAGLGLAAYLFWPKTGKKKR